MYCRFQRILFDLYIMMSLIFFFQTFQDPDTLVFCRFFNRNRLESSFQSRILLNILAVFRKSCCTDQLHLPSCQRWFQNIGCINRALCTTGTDNGMKFI